MCWGEWSKQDKNRKSPTLVRERYRKPISKQRRRSIWTIKVYHMSVNIETLIFHFVSEGICYIMAVLKVRWTDLEGKCLIPAFIDSHRHIVMNKWMVLYANLWN